MKNKWTTGLLVALLLLQGATAASFSKPRSDFGGSGDWWDVGTLEPNPPQTPRPDVELDDADLGVIYELIATGVKAGDRLVLSLADNPITFEIPDPAFDVPDPEKPDAPRPSGLVMKLVGSHSVQTLDLPPLSLDHGAPADDIDPTIPELDFTAYITPVTIVMDRAGDNPPTPPRVADVDKNHIIDATINVWGNIQSLHELAPPNPEAPTPQVDEPEAPEIKANPGKISKPDHVDVTVVRHDLVAPDVDLPLDLVAIDPESALLIGDPAELIDDTIALSTVYSTANDVQTQLDTLSEDALTVDTVLSLLKTGSLPIGIVDLTSFSTEFVTAGYSLEIIDTISGTEPKTILDPSTKQLTLVDGGFGDITFLSNQEKLAFDNDLITALKQPDSPEFTSFHFLTPKYDLGSVDFDAELGGYSQHLTKVQELAKRGVDLHVTKDPDLCAAATVTTSRMCSDPTGALQVPPKVAALLVQPLPRDAPGLPPTSKLTQSLPSIDASLPDSKPTILGDHTGRLKAIPSLADELDAPSPPTIALVQPTLPAAQLDRFTLGSWSVPSSGLASIPDVPSLDVDAPTLDLPKAPSLDYDATILDGIFEGFATPATPNLMPVVPIDSATGAASLVVDAAGNGVSTLPLDVLQTLPLGATSELVLRFVGDAKSIWSNAGIPGVSVEVSSVDPFGLSSTTYTADSNPNGYTTFAVPALASFTAIGRHDDYQDIEGSGQTPAPGGKAGQEYTMFSASGSKAGDFARDNSLILLATGVLLVAGLVLAKKKGLIRRRRK